MSRLSSLSAIVVTTILIIPSTIKVATMKILSRRERSIVGAALHFLFLVPLVAFTALAMWVVDLAGVREQDDD